MTFLSPWWLGAAGALAAAVVALHLLARRRPRPYLFPTARFIPDRPASAPSVASRPADLPLLFLRILLVVLLGAAFAQPVIAPERRTAHVVLVDRSRLAPPVDSASLAVLGSADMVIAFDSTGRVMEPGSATHPMPSSDAVGSLSAALVAVIREARRITGDGDSLGLTIISPFAEEEFDRATLRIRKQWMGQISLLPVSPRLPLIVTDRISVSPDDPLAPTVSLLHPGESSPARLIRRTALAADSAWARSGGALVIWPRVLAETDWSPGPGDTIGGVAVGNDAVVAAFFRSHVPPEGVVRAAWVDGKSAATETPMGKGCLRNVAIPIPESGDLVLRESFLRLTRAMLSPCHGRVRADPVSSSRLDSLRGEGGLLSALEMPGPQERKAPANRWLLLGAALLLLAEPLVRRRKIG